MKKIFILLSLAFVVAGCTTKTPTPTTPASSTPTSTSPLPSTDSTTSASPTSDAKTGASEKFEDTLKNVKLGIEDIKKIVTDKESNAVISDIDLDDDNKRIVYELDAIYNNKSYDIKIDANTGDIIKWELDN